MKLATILLILLTATLEAGLPKWFPASQGAVLKEAEERAEMDKKLAEYDERMLAVATIMEKHRPILEYMARNNLEMTESNLEVARANTVASQQSGDFLGSIIKSVTTGDPMAMIAVLTGGLGLLGAGSSHKQKKKAQGFRIKALKYAHMDSSESKKAIRQDEDFPDIIA